MTEPKFPKDFDLERVKGYHGIYDQFGAVFYEESVGSYQGDSVVLLLKDGWYGYLFFGWGSCSGCDSYEAAEGDPKEVLELAKDMHRVIKWFKTLEEVQQHVLDRLGVGSIEASYNDEWEKVCKEVCELNYGVVFLRISGGDQ